MQNSPFRSNRLAAAVAGSLFALGAGQALGTGYFYANKQTAETNFIAALAQCEAAVEIFRKQNDGHLVTVSSMSAMRGMPGTVITYAATKPASRLLPKAFEPI